MWEVSGEQGLTLALANCWAYLNKLATCVGRMF